MCYAVGSGTWWARQQKRHKPEHIVCVQVSDQNMNEEDELLSKKKISIIIDRTK